MIELVRQHRTELEGLCRRYRVRRLDLFGSAARGDYDPSRSDIDFVVEFIDLSVADGADRFLGLMLDLEDLFGRKVDLVSGTAIRNPYFRQVVNATRELLYAA